MNYYTEIKNELINNEINRKVKNYSINKNDLNTISEILYKEIRKLETIGLEEKK